MANQGWISLHRSVSEWEWIDNPNVFRVFMDALLNANHKDNKYQGVMIKAGSYTTSIEKIAVRTGLSKQNVRTAINKLKSTSELTMQTTTKYTLISITNWDKFQSTNKPTNKQLTNDQQTTNKPLTTNNNVNNEKNSNNEKKKYPEKLNVKVFEEWVSYRIKKKKKVSEEAKLKLIEKMTAFTFEQQQQVINHSIENDYQGLFFDKLKSITGRQTKDFDQKDYSQIPAGFNQ